MSATVHVATSPTDYAIAQRVLCRGQYAPWRTFLWFTPALIVLIIVMGAIQISLDALKVPSWISVPAQLIPAFYAYVKTAQFTSRFRFKSILDPKGAFLSPTDLKLEDDGVHWRNHRGEGRTAWHAIPRVEQTKTHVYVFVDRAMAHVVPMKCFSNEASAQEFVSLARRHIEAAHRMKG